MMPPNSVLVADDYPISAARLAEIIEADCVPMCTTVVALDGQQALSAALANRPSAAILAIDMPKLNGIEVARAILSAYPEEPPLLIAATSGADTWTRANESG